MDHLEISRVETGFQIEGFPDAERVVKIAGPKAQRLADLALHRSDLEFGLACLEAINRCPEDEMVSRTALWEAAIIHYMKCFGQSDSRFSLDPGRIYKAHPGAMEPFEFFKSLRNKNLVHDENSYTQCLTGAIVNKPDATKMIEKVICLSVIGVTLGQENYGNLHSLLTHAIQWVVEQFERLAEVLTAELESEPRESLCEREAITYHTPGPADVHTKRPAL